jgi:hypothetical protein
MPPHPALQKQVPFAEQFPFPEHTEEASQIYVIYRVSFVKRIPSSDTETL